MGLGPAAGGIPPDLRLFRCETLLTEAESPVRRDVGVLVAGSVIRQVGRYADLAPQVPSGSIVPVDGLVLPGFIDAHSHLRGLPLTEQGVPDTDLESWLLRLRTLTDLDPGDEALVAAGDLLSTGVTSVQGIVDSFARPEEYLRLIGDVAGALGVAGIRAELAVGLSDQAEYLPASPPPASLCRYGEVPHGTTAADFADLVATARRRWDRPLLRVGAGPVAPQWSSDELLAATSSLSAAAVRVHAHLLESRFQRSWINEDPVSRLRRSGLLGPEMSAAHGVWLTAGEIAELALREVTVVHCPSSNAGLLVGSAPVRSWLEARLPVALGMDSHPVGGRTDMLAEMRAALATADSLGEPLRPRQVLAIATQGGAAALGRPSQLGRIAPGYAADMIGALVTSGEHAVERMVRDGSAADIHEVVCAGRRLVSAGRLHCSAAVDAARARSRTRLGTDLAARAARQATAEADGAVLRGYLRSRAASVQGEGGR